MEFPAIDRVNIDLAQIQQFSTEGAFVGLSVDMLVEVASYVCVVGNIYPYQSKAWDSSQAVIGGHLVRLSKLISAMLDQTCQKRRETSFMFSRMAFECIINLSFLLKNYSPDLLVSYKSYSLKHEKKLINVINENIKLRNGEVLPIEKRMLKSISSAFRVSKIKPEDIQPKELRNWGGKNIYEKATDVGLGEAYIAVFGGPSHSIHGNWQDLLDYHLKENGDGQFVADFDWHRPRPQYLNAVALHAGEVLKKYLSWLECEECESLVDTLDEYQSRLTELDTAHENWLVNKA